MTALVMSKKPTRNRKIAHLTLSELAKNEGRKLAEARGIKLSQLVEMLIREALEKVGKLPKQK
jgi:hypothetical protein